jgi:hypothetical protein
MWCHEWLDAKQLISKRQAIRPKALLALAANRNDCVAFTCKSFAIKHIPSLSANYFWRNFLLFNWNKLRTNQDQPGASRSFITGI